MSTVRDGDVSSQTRVASDAPRRTVPATYERAKTEIVRSRSQLTAARESLELAVGILRHLNDGSVLTRDTVDILESVIGDLEQAEAVLRIPL